ncbi:MAG TPA: flagellin [Candidatus Acidoferrum sp.]|nr:flagellin [Candidatus Acidoferrum sp.]
MAISLLNNITALEAQNQLNITQNNLQKTLFQLSSGSRINSGADDAAGLAIANGLAANVTALTQSSANANTGVGSLQVADGALAQVTTLLNRAVTLATESATGTVGTSQRGALQAEYSQIQSEIDSIGSTTSFNGSAVFNSAPASIFLSDGTNNTTISANQINLTSASLLQAAGQSGTLSASGAIAANDTVTVGNTVYTFVAASNAGTAAPSTLAAANTTGATAQVGATAGAVKVLIDSNTNDSAQTQITNTLANLVAAVNGGAGSGTVFQAGGNANPDATAVSNGLSTTFSATAAGLALGVSGNGSDASGNVVLSTTSAGLALLGANVAGTGLLATGAAGTDLSTATDAQAALGAINTAIATIAADRGNLGAVINRLQAASNVESVQVQNLTSAENQITAANIPQQVTNLSEYSILNQSGISALAQANSAQQSILKLLQ